MRLGSRVFESATTVEIDRLPPEYQRRKSWPTDDVPHKKRTQAQPFGKTKAQLFLISYSAVPLSGAASLPALPFPRIRPPDRTPPNALSPPAFGIANLKASTSLVVK
jgi:hypothetical protein